MKTPIRSTVLLLLGLTLLPAVGARSARADGGGGDAGLPPGTRTDVVLVRIGNPLALPGLNLCGGTLSAATIPGTDWVQVHVPSGKAATTYRDQLDGSFGIAAVALDLGLESPDGAGSTIPAGGSLLASQIPTQSELERIGASDARARATGDGVVVAVLDTGILADLDGVSGHVATGGHDFVDGDDDPTDEANGVDDDGDGLVDEDYAHGTFAASLVLAVAPDATILPLRVLDADGIGTSSRIASAIAYAVTHGVQVINLSVRIPAQALPVAQAIAGARSAGVLVVVAAGNTGGEDATTTPSATSDALVVTCVDADDVRPTFATYGNEVDLAAPGVDLSGAYPASPGTAIWSGTSFATALVTGGYALLREQHPSWSVDDVVERLEATAASLSDANPTLAAKLGAGRLDLDAATAP